MSNHTYTCFIYHLVWATKDRKKLINSEFKDDLYKFIANFMIQRNWHPIAIGGISDHIHILIKFKKELLVSEIVSKIKSNSCKFLREKVDANFNWQNGYSSFTVDNTSIFKLKKYIENQEKHHEDITVEKEEFLLLKRYNYI